ncbi:MAG TPA: glycosyltransferase family 4 protein [Stellaceae bacterium]|nr:glycosyltransferase family 4 protein [Stellaceae bacterium]
MAVDAIETTARRAAMRRVLVQPGRSAFPDMVSFIVERFGFELVQLSDYEIGRPQSKLTHLRGLMRQALDVVGALPRLRNCECVIAFGPILYLIKLLRRVGLLNYRQSVSLGWHIRSPRWFPLFRAVSKLDRDEDHYIVFSEVEIDLYSANLGIDRRRLHYLPYGDWHPQDAPADRVELPASGQYYFAGGYSNRDYVSLIEAFRSIDARLVIVCSALNSEIDETALPPNVTVWRDLPSDAFEMYLRQAKACILPLKFDTGASGQSVLIRAMRNGTPAIASDFGSLRGYIADGVSGYLFKDLARELPGIVAAIEREPAQAKRLGEAAQARYRKFFSPAAGAASLARILSGLIV